ncbi:AAA family ATPase [Pseudomonas alliivorans]|uniref:AAA family ATPase n=1 Tax=unclassified Pseudomonas TaxID=196821 RepID=UPI000D39B59E|nr:MULTISPECIES: AAA family ATPase [unclassified Pseudomonas]MEE4343519.1 AAA family ATPase [Pseudomonas alliivorans]MEE5126394.1 AAA family ATPase [Pseudomonas alliivorans]MEE5162493.1 AAA family ATPase [Pseudomonas alliivorans]RAU49543.1 ATP-binding protein [Pseudomonas sp. RIT 409]RAU55718.1 ATP-binding protein [Pseudomonas sp. RIT 412]
MLRKFSVKNFRNFTDWLCFDLTSQQYEFNEIAVSKGIVRHAMIYGPNGGGKSNLGLAMVDPVLHLVDSPSYFPSLNNNYLNGRSSAQIAEFIFEFRIGDAEIVYKYGKKAWDKLVYEHLTINEINVLYVDRRKSTLASIALNGAETLKNDVGDSWISLLKYVKSNAILDDTTINKTFLALLEFIEGMVFFRSLNATNKGEYVGKDIGVKQLSQSIIESNSIEDFERFLNDAGIECSLVVDINPNASGNKSIYFNFGEIKLEFGTAASTGTLSLGIFYFWWLRLNKGEVKFAYIDEFDAFYHHALASTIVEKITTSQAQTIMTTHNTGVMSNDLLRPDCYFVLDKKISPLTALTDKELRKAHNLEKIYKGLSS